MACLVDFIDAYCQGEYKRIDYAGKLYEKEGKAYWKFGKHRDKLVTETRDYCNWVLGKDFPADTKEHIRRILFA